MNLAHTLKILGFGLRYVPLIFIVRPSVLRLDEECCEIKIPLNYITRNHLGSMYFGTLAVGADVAGGLIALEQTAKLDRKVQVVFKDFKADFLKRPEADVHFTCRDGKKILRQIAQTCKTGERVNRRLDIVATTPSLSGDEPVAKFQLTLSLKALS